MEEIIIETKMLNLQRKRKRKSLSKNQRKKHRK
jgi:hypothetical protein